MSFRGWKTTCKHSLAVSHGRSSLGRNIPSWGWPPGQLWCPSGAPTQGSLQSPRVPRREGGKEGVCPSAPSTRTDRAGATGPEWLPCPAHDHTVLASPGTENMQRAVNRALAESPSTGTELGARVSLAVWALCSFSHTWDHPDVALGAGGLHSRARSPPPAPRASPTRCFQDSPLPRTGLQSHGSSVPKPSRTPGSKGPSAVPLPSAGLIPTPLHSCLRARWLQPGGGRGFLDHRQYSHVTDDPPPTHTHVPFLQQTDYS